MLGKEIGEFIDDLRRLSEVPQMSLILKERGRHIGEVRVSRTVGESGHNGKSHLSDRAIFNILRSAPKTAIAHAFMKSFGKPNSFGSDGEEGSSQVNVTISGNKPTRTKISHALEAAFGDPDGFGKGRRLNSLTWGKNT